MMNSDPQYRAVQSFESGNAGSPEETRDLKDFVNTDVLQALRGLQFGEVIITVRDSHLVQVERIAKQRNQLRKRRRQ